MPPFLKSSAFILLASSLLLACSAQPLATPRPAPTVAPDALTRVAEFQTSLSQLSESALVAEAARLAAVPGLEALVQQALVLAQQRDEESLARALALLEPLAQSAATGIAPWPALAQLLAHGWRLELAEQQRWQEQLAQQAQQLRESQRRNDQLSDRVEQLGHKLDALRSIELNLPKPAAKPPATLPGPGSALPGSATRSPAS